MHPCWIKVWIYYWHQMLVMTSVFSLVWFDLTGSSEIQDDHRDSSSTQNPPVIRAPPRKTSRRLWRRQLDSSSSDNSPMTANPVNSVRLDTAEDHRRRAGKTHTPSQNRSISFSFADVSSEFDFPDINSSVASAPAQRHINSHDSSDLKPGVQTNEESTQKPLKITGTDTEEHEQTSPDSLVSLLTIFKKKSNTVKMHRRWFHRSPFSSRVLRSSEAHSLMKENQTLPDPSPVWSGRTLWCREHGVL